ncbi:hypothetical protein L1987_21890 [Smallanthus sonchifolius]|uniref:Uncharacterized protein n=1 Tax=Smallanthus sonchifolius TaxID=185202 RepID=A0ACB9IDZ4_9ASTR|nr:hypothetical protein L1987_21890 [Smallanthus sonchifolius]
MVWREPPSLDKVTIDGDHGDDSFFGGNGRRERLSWWISGNGSKSLEGFEPFRVSVKVLWSCSLLANLGMGGKEELRALLLESERSSLIMVLVSTCQQGCTVGSP